jgi:hypothetical protein
MARAYYFMTSDLSEEEMQKKGAVWEVPGRFRPLKPYRVQFDGGDLVEIPVTRCCSQIADPCQLSALPEPIFPAIARCYFRMALET